MSDLYSSHAAIVVSLLKMSRYVEHSDLWKWIGINPDSGEGTFSVNISIQFTAHYGRSVWTDHKNSLGVETLTAQVQFGNNFSESRVTLTCNMIFIL